LILSPNGTVESLKGFFEHGLDASGLSLVDYQVYRDGMDMILQPRALPDETIVLREFFSYPTTPSLVLPNENVLQGTSDLNGILEGEFYSIPQVFKTGVFGSSEDQIPLIGKDGENETVVSEEQNSQDSVYGLSVQVASRGIEGNRFDFELFGHLPRLEIHLHEFSYQNLFIKNPHDRKIENDESESNYIHPESLIGGDNSNDSLTAGDGNDRLVGNGGDDVLKGGAGHDDLYGGDGEDTMYGGSGSDYLLGNDGIDTIYGGNGSDELHGNQLGDFLYGGGGDDYLWGGRGDDTLYGDAGNDTLGGGRDTDTVSYKFATGGVTVDLSTTAEQDIGGGMGTDVVRDNENLEGSEFADTLTGDANANVMTGLAGSDTINGGNGNDTFTYTATALDSGDLAKTETDTTDATVNDMIDFSGTMEGLLKTGGTLLSALGANTALAGALDANNNIALVDAGGGDMFIYVDLNGDGAFASADDFSIDIENSVATATYDSGNDYITLT